MQITRRASKRSRPHRRIAALLAVVALLVMPVQVRAECPVSVAATDVDQVAAPHADHGPHAEHSQPSEPDPSPTEHAPCPDLVHCTAMAVSVEPTLRAADQVVHETVVARPTRAPTAPARAVEPPPPKH